MSVKIMGKLLTALFILTSVVCYGQFPSFENDEGTLFKNKVKEQITYQYIVFNGSLMGDSILTERQEYDRKGNIVKSLSYDNQGNETFKFLSEYNDQGHMIKQTEYERNIPISTFLYEYDTHGNQTDYRQVSSSGELFNHQKREYNRKNLNTKLFNRDGNGQFFLASKYSYNKAGNDTRTEIYNEQGFLVSVTTSEYDKSSRTWKYYEGRGKQRKMISQSICNQENQVIESTITGEVPITLAGGKVINKKNQLTRKFIYNANGLLIEKLVYDNLLLTECLRYRYITY